MLRKSILLGLALLAAAPAFSPAFAQGRGRGGNDHHDNRGGNDHRNDNRGPGNRGGNDRNDHRNDNRGGDWNRGNNRGNDWNRNNNWSWNDSYRRYDRGHTSLSLGFIFGSPGYAGYSPYDSYSYREPAYYNSWALAPGQCRWDREFAYWRSRPADVEVQRCADGYGNVYVVQQSTRLWRYR
jgi:hypothetical protein